MSHRPTVRSLAAVALLAAAACGTTTQVVPTNRSPRPLSPRSVAEVDVYTTSAPAMPFVEVAIIQARQSSQYSVDHMPEIILAMRQEAAQVGCDGVVIHGESNKVVSSGGWGDTATNTSSLDGYWGACIVYTGPVPVAMPVAAPAAYAPAAYAPAVAAPAAVAPAAVAPAAAPAVQQRDAEEPPAAP